MTIEDICAAISARQTIADQDLSDIAWNDAACADASFVGCRFAEVISTSTDFSGATFTRCRFERCRFGLTLLRDAKFSDCRFTVPGDPPSGCVFAFADLRNASLQGCDLSFARFERSDLHAITMETCNLLGASLNSVDFSHTIGRKTVVTRATFRHCNFDFSELADARMNSCELTGCRFREADLGGVDFTDATLCDSDFNQAILIRADVTGLNLLALASFTRMKITQSQADSLIAALRIDLYPDPP